MWVDPAMTLAAMTVVIREAPREFHPGGLSEFRRMTCSAADRYALPLSQRNSSSRPVALRGVPSLVIAVSRMVANTLPPGSVSSRAVQLTSP